MRFSREEMVELACRASTLQERLGGELLPAADEAGQSLAHRRWNRWVETAGDGKPERLVRRLAWGGYQERLARAMLGHVRVPQDWVVPDWLEAVNRALTQGEEEECPPWTLTGPNMAFAPLLAPSVALSCQRVEDLVPEGLLQSGAWDGLRTSLASRLRDVMGRVLLAEFHRRRSPSLAGSSAQHDNFCAEMRAGGLRAFLLERSALARMMGICILNWETVIVEMFNRLEQDRAEMAEWLGVTPQDLTVVRVDPDLSDRHCGGRCVFALELSSGHKVYYKPRAGGIEKAFGDFLEWFNAQGPELQLLIPRSCYAGDHFWMMEVPHTPLAPEQHPENFFRRAGMLLALLYGLGGRDCHSENLLTSGEHPVIVDAETVVEAAPATRATLPCAGFQALEGSLLRTLLPPFWMDDDGLFDPSGLGADPAYDMRMPPGWVFVGTDQVDFVGQPSQAKPRHRPTRGDRVYSARDFLPALEAGFDEGYRVLLERRTELLDSGSPLLRLGDQPNRLLLRDTRLYYSLLKSLSTDRFMFEGIDRDLELEILVQAFVYHEECPPTWPLAVSEILTLQRGEIPYFKTSPEQHSIVYGEGSLAEAMVPGRQALARRLDRLSPEDHRFQKMLLRSSFCLKADGPRPTMARPNQESAADASWPGLEQGAGKLGQELERVSLADPTHGLDWVGLLRIPGHARVRHLGVLHPFLDEGRVGVALFLAASARVLGRDSAAAIALRVARCIPQELGELQVNPPQVVPVGGLDGLASLIYGLDLITGWLGERPLYEQTLELALPLLETYSSRASLDLYSGLAGVVLVLLRAGCLEQAARFGRRLLAQRVTAGAGSSGWPELGAGLARGLAGISLALLELYRRTGEEDFRKGALDAISQEQRMAGLPMECELAEEAIPCWCAGWPGIGLARLAVLDLCDTPAIRAEIGEAIAAARQDHGWDSYCGGIMGNTETLLTASAVLGDDSLRQAACELGAQCARQAQSRGWYRLARGQCGEILLPGLMTGQAGVGYQLLRLCHPEILPSLTWWTPR